MNGPSGSGANEPAAGAELDIRSLRILERARTIAPEVEFRGHARPSPPHPAAISPDEQAHHLVRQGVPMLVCADHVPVPGGVARPIEPAPMFPWSIVSRAGASRRAVSGLEAAAAHLARDGRWLELPAGAWLPEPEATRLDRLELRPAAERAADSA